MARKQTVSEKVVELFSTIDVKYGEELLGIAKAILRQRGPAAPRKLRKAAPQETRGIEE